MSKLRAKYSLWSHERKLRMAILKSDKVANASVPCHSVLSVTGNLAIFSNNTIDQPLSCISSELFADKHPNTMENFYAVSTRDRKDSVTRISAFIELFQDSCVRVVTSHAITALAASPSMGEIWWELHPKHPQVLASFLWQIQDKTEIVPSFSSHCQDCVLWKGKRWHEYPGSQEVPDQQEKYRCQGGQLDPFGLYTFSSPECPFCISGTCTKEFFKGQ